MSAPFSTRHIGPSEADRKAMLKALGVTSVETIISQTVPASIRLGRDLNIPEAASEAEALAELQEKFSQNVVLKSFYGQGYHGTHVPPVIQRNLFENPAWYTAYTPYQAEISQGRLELLFHFQTLVCELTGLDVASASLLDEATAVAEAVGIAVRHHKGERNRIVIAGALHPQVTDVIETRAEPIGLTVDCETIDAQTAAVLVPWPDTYGVYGDYTKVIKDAKAAGALVIAVCDPLALVLTQSPASWGADIAAGSMQRFGVPIMFGGPHAAYLAVTDALTRLMPGRLVGQSVDAKGRAGYRLALQTREQHIRRDKATSNICTAQALLANMAASYAVWHGPDGLTQIAGQVHSLACRFADAVVEAGHAVEGNKFFDTVTIKAAGRATAIAALAEKGGRFVRVIDADRLAVTFDETSSEVDAFELAELFGASLLSADAESRMPKRRSGNFMTQPVFHENRSETQMMRFLRRLADKDLALDRAMIPLGSCTMKLNAAAEMMPVSWSSVANLHPFAPDRHTKGIRGMIVELEKWLAEITGFDAVSLQPNAGSQGEYAGLLAIRAYHASRGEKHRNVCIIPSSAHGTNPASAAMAGFDVVVVKCTESGDVDVLDLTAKAAQFADRLAALMITYPSTHGVFEETVRDICKVVHDHGGQVYLDGANLNAMVGLARPGDIGADVCHMNLHKTFAIPHGGGGPGVGPIGVAAHLKKFLPGHVTRKSRHAVSAAPWGSAGILAISWMYIRMLGPDGLRNASENAILSANYIAARLKEHFPVLYTGTNGRVAHECIFDFRPFKETAGIGVEDVAKRLIDYGFHAPTMSWPVAGTLMVEPTESEPKGELDRFCEAMIAIAREIQAVADGKWSKGDNPLVNAPHTAEEVTSEAWGHPYSRAIAAFPEGSGQSASKYWPPVARIDNVYGDRNLVCSCPPIEAIAV
ncbi:MAG: aminomethyl-transferring glycine dehydrogenase [Rhizobiaceae bacterium]